MLTFCKEQARATALPRTAKPPPPSLRLRWTWGHALPQDTTVFLKAALSADFGHALCLHECFDASAAISCISRSVKFNFFLEFLLEVARRGCQVMDDHRVDNPHRRIAPVPEVLIKGS